MELLLPDGNGIKILENAKIPAIVITGVEDIETMKKCKELGAVSYIIKPFETQRIVKEVENLLTSTVSSEEVMITMNPLGKLTSSGSAKNLENKRLILSSIHVLKQKLEEILNPGKFKFMFGEGEHWKIVGLYKDENFTVMFSPPTKTIEEMLNNLIKNLNFTKIFKESL